MQHVKQLNHHSTLPSFDALLTDFSSCNELYLKHFVLFFIDIIWIQIFAMSNSSFVLIIPSLLNQLFISELNFFLNIFSYYFKLFLLVFFGFSQFFFFILFTLFSIYHQKWVKLSNYHFVYHHNIHVSSSNTFINWRRVVPSFFSYNFFIFLCLLSCKLHRHHRQILATLPQKIQIFSSKIAYSIKLHYFSIRPACMLVGRIAWFFFIEIWINYIFRLLGKLKKRDEKIWKS